MAHLVSSSTTLALLTNMSEKCKSMSGTAIQVKKVNKMLAHADMLDLLIVAYIQFLITLIELNKVLSI